MKTLIIDNFDSFTYNLYQYFAQLNGNPEVFRNNEITIPQIIKNRYTHLVISPGPGTPDNKKDFGICMEVISKFAGKLPILGVCLGHQGIVSYFGGKIVRAVLPMHGKQSLIKIDTKSPLFKGLPDKISVMRYHSLLGERENLPVSLKLIGHTLDDGLVMAVEHVTMPIYGVQFHPESIGTPSGIKIISNFLQI